MGVKIQRPGEPGHPGGNRRIYVRVNHGGHRKTRVFNSTKAAEKYAETVEYLLKHGKPEEVFREPAPAAAPPAPTFKEAADRWWAVDGANFKGGTRDTYLNILETRILPVFGPKRIADITLADVEDWWADLRATGLSRKHVGNMRTVLTGIFRRAVSADLLSRNPAEAIRGRLGREDREVRQVEWLTEPELTRLLEVARQRGSRYHPFLLTVATTGLRAGEALALQVGDVDLERCKLSIRRAIRKHRLGSPKSGKPRTVDVPPASIAVLCNWLDVIRAEAAVRGEEACWLFPSRTGRQPMDETPIRSAFRRCLPVAGIRREVRIHDLRHTYASLALQRGVPLLVVSRQLGHASIAITADVYGHLVPDATRQAADAWEAILTEHSRNSGATTPPEGS
jgi:integrase